MKFVNRSLKIFSFAVLLTASFTGQSVKKLTTDMLPFVAGEKLTYEAKISKIIPGISVADLIFTVDDPPEANTLLIRAEARSKGTLLRIARYSFSQQIESTVEYPEFRILKTVKQDTQKDRVRESEALFDYQQRRVTYTETDPRDPTRPPRRIASELNGVTQDLISAIYSVRLLPLAVGRSFSVQVSDSGFVYNIPVKVTARERMKTIFGNVMCYRLEPLVFGRGRLIEKEGSMILWITDDSRRVPVRSQVNAPFGRVEIKLKSAVNLK